MCWSMPNFWKPVQFKWNLCNEESITGQEKSSEQRFYVTCEETCENVKIDLQVGSGDPELLVLDDSPPSFESFNCNPTLPTCCSSRRGSKESCSISTNLDFFYVLVYGNTKYENGIITFENVLNVRPTVCIKNNQCEENEMCNDGSCIILTTPIPLMNTTTVDPFLLEDINEPLNWNDTIINNANRTNSIELEENSSIAPPNVTNASLIDSFLPETTKPSSINDTIDVNSISEEETTNLEIATIHLITKYETEEITTTTESPRDLNKIP